jgi:hypothetical protein
MSPQVTPKAHKPLHMHRVQGAIIILYRYTYFNYIVMIADPRSSAQISGKVLVLLLVLGPGFGLANS